MDKVNKLTIKILFIIILMLILISISNFSEATTKIQIRYKITEDNYMIGVYSNSKVSDLKNELAPEEQITFYNNAGQEVGNEAILKTGDKLSTSDKTYTLIICGDTAPDGRISPTDLVKEKRHLVSIEELNGERKVAADIDANGKVTVTDLLYLKRLSVGLISEEDIFFQKNSNEHFNYKKNKLTNQIVITSVKTGINKTELQIPVQIDGTNVTSIESILGINNSITKIVVPLSLEHLDSNAFTEFDALEEIVVDNNNKTFSSNNGVLFSKTQEELIFYPIAKKETNYIVNPSVNAIGNNAFYKNKNLEKLYLLDTVASVSNSSFEQMKAKLYVKEHAGIISVLDNLEINYEIDEKPKLLSLKVISPESGEYEPGEQITIRAQFSENISGTAPTLQVKVGDSIGTGKIIVSNPTGNLNYIDYTYTIGTEDGKIDIYSFSGGNIVDILSSQAEIILIANTGNVVTANNQTKFGPYTYSTTGTVKNSYKDSSIEVSIESINSINVAKIWIKNPSKQIVKGEAGWNVENKTLKNMFKDIPDLIIGCNGSFFYDNGANWSPSSSTDIGKSPWKYTTEGHSVISNGVIRRNFQNTGYRATVMGIDKNGQLMCQNIRNLTASEMISSYNIVNTFAASTVFIENGELTGEDNTSGASNSQSTGRTLLGQVNYNNYILMCGSTSFDNAINAATKLDCQFLFGLDGGGSSAMFFQGEYIKSSSRSVQDAVYFTTLD